MINANALNGVISNDDYEKVLNAPCIFADLPNGLDGEHYNLQEPKTGHWIIEVWNNKEHHTCSNCQHVVTYEPCYHYCPYCGAKMVEPQESEDEE
jgi:hypothetical protein